MKYVPVYILFISATVLIHTFSFAHHEEEVYMFLYFSQEPGVLKISTFILGTFLILCGIYISYKASIQVRKKNTSKKQMFSPGIVTVVIGVVMILLSIFILSNNPKIKYEQKSPISAPSKITKSH